MFAKPSTWKQQKLLVQGASDLCNTQSELGCAWLVAWLMIIVQCLCSLIAASVMQLLAHVFHIQLVKPAA
jgi:hypothetical protein